MEAKFYVYVAGPLHGSGLELENIRKALYWAEIVKGDGMIPFVPHLYSFWNFWAPHSAEFWLRLDFAWLQCCNALLRIPGGSPGSEKEVKYCIEKGISVYTTDCYQDLLEHFKKEHSTVRRNCVPLPGPEKMKGYEDQFGGQDVFPFGQIDDDIGPCTD